MSHILPSGMPLVHHARRSIRNFAEGNPFVGRRELEALLEALAADYLRPGAGPGVSRLLQVEMDAIESLLARLAVPAVA